MRSRTKAAALAAGVVSLGLLLAGCTGGGNSSSGSTKTKGATITVAWASVPPPKAELDAFTAKTGIKVKWSNIDWDSLQTKIAAAAMSKTYFADVTDVDWSRVGQLGKLDWFYPMGNFVDTKALAADVPQLSSFMYKGQAVGVPFDSSFMVTTNNNSLFAKAGITTPPKTIDEYTADLQQIKTKGVVQYPLNIPFAAAEGLSTYWYETTGAFGGTILNGKGQPQFTSRDSAGYKAAAWMINALKSGLVAPGSINATDGQGQQDLMAKGQVASTFSDYSGNVGTLYNSAADSTVVDQVSYAPTPGANGAGPNLGNPDGIGIPRQAKYPAAAAEFIKWATSTQVQADFAGANGADKVMTGYPMPSRLSAIAQLTTKGKLIGGQQLSDMLKHNYKPVFPQGAPSWYPQLSQAVSTNLHAAAIGSITVDAAIKAIAQTASSLANGS